MTMTMRFLGYYEIVCSGIGTTKNSKPMYDICSMAYFSF